MFGKLHFMVGVDKVRSKMRREWERSSATGKGSWLGQVNTCKFNIYKIFKIRQSFNTVPQIKTDIGKFIRNNMKVNKRFYFI